MEVKMQEVHGLDPAQVQKRRWFILFSYSGLTFMNGATYCALSPIGEEAEKFYNVSQDSISLFAVSFFIMYLPLSPFSTCILGKSYHYSIILAWILTFVGCWIKFLANSNYPLALFGIFLVASAGPITLPACSPLAERWFSTKEQVLATSIGSIINFIGIGFSFVLDPFLNDIPTINLIHAAFSSFFIIFNILSSKKEGKIENKIGFVRGIKQMFKNKIILCIIFCSGSGLAVSYAVLGILSVVLEQNELTSVEVGWIGFDMVMMGMIGGIIATFMAGKFKNIGSPLRIFLVCSMMSTIVWAGIQEDFIGSLIGAGIFGVSLIGHVPLGIRAAVEQDTKIEESIPTNMIFFMGNVFSLAYTYPIQYFYSLTEASGLWIASILIFISFSIFIFVYRIPTNNCKQIFTENADHHEDIEQRHLETKISQN